MATEMTDETRIPGPKTSPEQRADLRDALERVGRGEPWWEQGRDNVSGLLAAAPALLADADALAGAAALRAQYTPATVPRCSQCGEEMVVKAYEDRQVCWECHGCGIFSWTADSGPDALARARDEIIPALDQIGICAGWLAESGPGDERTSIARLGIDQAVKAIRAALAPGTGGASE